MHSCSKCTNPADIQVNVLKYCNPCFLTLFEQKMQRNMPKLHSSSSVLVYLKDSPLSTVAAELLNKILSGRKFKKVGIFCRNPLLFKTDIQPLAVEFSSENEHSLKRQNSDVIQYCLENSYDTLFHAESMDQAIAESLLLLCTGQGHDAVNYCSKSQYGHLNVVNVFEGIKEREISHYLHLRGMSGIEDKHGCMLGNRVAAIRAVIDKFIFELDEKNELAFFNIKNTFAKLHKNDQA